MRIVISALWLVPAVALASSSLDGTWKGRADSVKVSGKPDTLVVAEGMYTCSSCVPEIRIKADGTDQKVTGHEYYDTVAVKIVDANNSQRVLHREARRGGTRRLARHLRVMAAGEDDRGQRRSQHRDL